MRTIWLSVLIVLALSGAAWAGELELSYGDPTPATFERLETDAHFIHFFRPSDWAKAFSQEVSFYGKRYGDVSGIKGTLLILVPTDDADEATVALPKRDKLGKPEKQYVYLSILQRAQFNLSDTPDEGWFTIKFEPMELPEEFWVSLYTYSNDERGLELGLTSEKGSGSFSSQARPGVSGSSESTLNYRKDGRDWLIRSKIRSTLEPAESMTSEQLTGAEYTYFDDGTAEGFDTVQKLGPMLQISNSSKRRVNRVYVYAKVEGDWFNTERAASVYLLDKDFRIIKRMSLPYVNYVPDPAWSYVEFPNTEVPQDFYVLVEPVSRPSVSLWLGYDSSGANQASGFGTPGARQAWGSSAPEEKTNWMIRVHYKP